MKSGVLGRSVKLLAMASQLAKHEAVKGFKDSISSNIDEYAPRQLKTRIEQAKILAQNLSALKGAAMKAGQLLSLDSSDILPPEAIEILSMLQNSAQAEDIEVMRAVVIKEWGAEKFALINNLSEKPVACASIGQVHRAEFEGQQVAIKIQYPDVDKSIDSDLTILRKLSETLMGVNGKKISLKGLFEELAQVLHQEADYVYELNALHRFKKLVSDDSELRVPDTLDDFCTKHILTMSFEQGQHLGPWLETNPSREKREWVGRKILDLYCKEFFEWGFVQTDPNYGNFLIQENPMRLVLLDFGASIEYSSEFRTSYVELLRSFASTKDREILEACLGFGIIDSRESDEVKDLLVAFMKAAIEPFMPELQPFRFRDEDYARRSTQIGRDFTKALKYSPPPKDLIFLHRKLGGMFNMLRKMDVALNLTPYWKKMIRTELPQSW